MASGALLLSLCACGESFSSIAASSSSVPASSAVSSAQDDVPFNGTGYYDRIESRVSFDRSNENDIDESFAGGAMSDDYWNALSGVWQNDSASYPHNGVQIRNLFYVTNGGKTYLAFKGRGVYSSDLDTVVKNGYREPEGACIVSKQHLGPGRYEIEMAAMPREGGVSAMWTYCSTTGSEATSQNEIDIEIGGNTSETYKHEWCTSWTKHTSKATVNVDVSPLCYLNDGKIHKYTFDWYTNHQNTGEKRVDWFLDGVLIATVKGDEVSETEMPLWIGLWFPNWSSVAAFDTDYMLVSSIRYTAFDSTQDYENCRANPGYAQIAPSAADIHALSWAEVSAVNKLANGSFESLDVCKQDQSRFGWVLDSASKGTLDLIDDHTDGAKALRLAAGEGSGNHGEYLMQTVTNAYEGYRYAYSIDAKQLLSGSDAQIEFHLSTAKTPDYAAPIVIKIDSETWKTYSGTILIPAKIEELRLDLVVADGAAAFDKASLRFLGAE